MKTVGILKDMEIQNARFAKDALATMANVVRALKLMTNEVIPRDGCIISLLSCFYVRRWQNCEELKQSKETRLEASEQERNLIAKQTKLCLINGWPEDMKNFLIWMTCARATFQGLPLQKQQQVAHQRRVVQECVIHVVGDGEDLAEVKCAFLAPSQNHRAEMNGS